MVADIEDKDEEREEDDVAANEGRKDGKGHFGEANIM